MSQEGVRAVSPVLFIAHVLLGSRNEDFVRELNCAGEMLVLSPGVFFVCVVPAMSDLQYSQFSISGQQH